MRDSDRIVDGGPLEVDDGPLAVDEWGYLDGHEIVRPGVCPSCWPAIRVVPPTFAEPRKWRCQIVHTADCVIFGRPAPAPVQLVLDLDRQETRP